MGNDTLQTVTEAQAPAGTREIFEDIKSTMGVALVNLVWRHLAIEPQVLESSWRALKPHYDSGAIPISARVLRASVAPPTLAPLTASERDQIAADTADPSLLDAVLHTYELGNAQNLVAMCLLRRRLAGDDTPDTPAEQIREVGGPTAQRPDHPATDIPPLPAMQSLPDTAQRQIEDMTSVWVPARYSGFTPSVFRHIAIWPSALDSYHTRLCALSADTLATPINQAQHLANREAEQLPSRSGELSALNNRETQWLQYTLDRFIDGMISPGVVLVPAMRAVIKRNS